MIEMSPCWWGGFVNGVMWTVIAGIGVRLVIDILKGR